MKNCTTWKIVNVMTYRIVVKRKITPWATRVYNPLKIINTMQAQFASFQGETTAKTMFLGR
jgi:hypothetical protein